MGKKIPEETREVARALVKAGKTYREVARMLAIGVGSVYTIMTEDGDELGRIIDEIKKRSAARHYLLAEHILSMITDSNVYRATLKEKVIAAAILTEKARLIEGSSTGNFAIAARGLAETASPRLPEPAPEPAPEPGPEPEPAPELEIDGQDDLDDLNRLNISGSAETEEIQGVGAENPV